MNRNGVDSLTQPEGQREQNKYRKPNDREILSQVLMALQDFGGRWGHYGVTLTGKVGDATRDHLQPTHKPLQDPYLIG